MNFLRNLTITGSTEAENSIHTPTTDEGFDPTTVSGREEKWQFNYVFCNNFSISRKQ